MNWDLVEAPQGVVRVKKNLRFSVRPQMVIKQTVKQVFVNIAPLVQMVPVVMTPIIPMIPGRGAMSVGDALKLLPIYTAVLLAEE